MAAPVLPAAADAGGGARDEIRRLRDTSDRRLARWFLAIGIGVGLVQVPLNVAEGRPELAWAFAAFVLILALGDVLLGHVVRPRVLALLGLAVVLGIEVFGGTLIVRSGVVAYMPWVFVFVPVAISVAGLGFGVILVVALGTWLIAAFWIFESTLPVPMFRELMIAYAALAGVTALYEALRRFYERLLARLHSRLHELASLDQLTRAFNRRTINQLLARELHRVRDGAPAFSVVLFDLDHFKRVNDTFGHEAGDRVLQGTAERTVASIRASDSFARWGGEEFLVLCSGATLEEAHMVAERVRASLEATDFPGVGRVTASFGVARLRSEDDIADVIRRADEALYGAKRGGRNTIGARR